MRVRGAYIMHSREFILKMRCAFKSRISFFLLLFSRCRGIEFCLQCMHGTSFSSLIILIIRRSEEEGYTVKPF